MRYAIVDNGFVVNVAESDKALASNWIQSDSASKGYSWDGNDFTAPPGPSAEEIEAEMITEFGDAVQGHLDEECKPHSYDGILSLCTYAASTVPSFKAEGQAGVEWRDACWAYTYTQLALVQSGDRAVPTVDELLSELPDMVWPV